MTKTVALVVAAGRGHRVGGEIPKQYLQLGGRTVLRHCLETFGAHPRIDACRVVIHPDDLELYRGAVGGLSILEPVPGGATRQESVRLGLESLEASGPDRVLIHDAARPFVSAAVIDELIAALDGHDGAVVAIPVADTLKRVLNGKVVTTVDRQGLWRAQTPQAFHFAPILAAHRTAEGAALTDDVAVAERAGMTVAVVEGSDANFKVTTAEDLQRAEQKLSRTDAPVGVEYRNGQGFDVHRFGPGDHVILCGIRIPHTAGLVGHSDADAGLHAMTDAILGAVAAGDIGDHFPPGDPQWRDADSAVFLKHAAALVAARGGSIVHLDLTLICERPKIGPHRDAMAERVREILRLGPGRVGVKATTSERLGFPGRDEGLAALATATVRLPLGE